MPLISVIIPFKNETLLLQKCLDSLSCQSFKNFETILISDGASSQSLQIAKSHTLHQKQVVELAYSQGQSNARNIGIAKATGKFIALLDADDSCASTRFEMQVKAFSLQPKLDVCGTAAITEPAKTKWQVYSKNSHIRHQAILNNPFINSSLMIKKSIFDHFRYNSNLDTVEDYDFVYYLIQTGCNLYNIPKYLVNYTQNIRSKEQNETQILLARSIKERWLHNTSSALRLKFHYFCELEKGLQKKEIIQLIESKITNKAILIDQAIRYILKHKTPFSLVKRIHLWLFSNQLKTISVLYRLIKV